MDSCCGPKENISMWGENTHYSANCGSNTAHACTHGNTAQRATVLIRHGQG